jgi:hypothetical protein
VEWRSRLLTLGNTPHRHPLHQTQIRGSHHQGGETGFSLSKSCKLLICSLKASRKPPSQDRRSVFSAVTQRSMHTVLKSSPGTHTPPTWCPSFIPLTLFPRPPAWRLTRLTSLPYTSVPCPTHHYTFSLPFPRPTKQPFFRTNLYSCPCLLLVRSVVVWEPRGFILSHGEPMGTKVCSSISLLLPL